MKIMNNILDYYNGPPTRLFYMFKTKQMKINKYVLKKQTKYKEVHNHFFYLFVVMFHDVVVSAFMRRSCPLMVASCASMVLRRDDTIPRNVFLISSLLLLPLLLSVTKGDIGAAVAVDLGVAGADGVVPRGERCRCACCA
jgi:hypothetical protein